MSPKNGWRLEEVARDYHDHETKLYLSLFVNLRVARRVCVRSWPPETPKAQRQAEKSREIIFWGAVAHYLNSGGIPDVSAEVLYNLLFLPDPEDEENALAAVCPPDGYALVLTTRAWFDVDGQLLDRPEHVFVSNSAPLALHWVEDVRWEFREQQEVREQLDLADDVSSTE